jgi:hypothetical protein
VCASIVPVAAPWGGLRREYQSLQSSLWPLPSPAVFGAAQPLVTTKSRNYSAGDVADFFFVISLATMVFMRTICWGRPRLVVLHETAPQQVLLQLSEIRVDPALEFA